MSKKKVKELSAGILFFTEDNKLFMGRVTNSGGIGTSLPSRWDIPKGQVELGETPMEAALRECEEETGFVQFDPAFLKDLGQHDYASNKDIHLFQYMVPVRHEQFKDCICTAYHTAEDGSSFPEIDAFALIHPKQWLYVMGPSLYNVMQKLYRPLLVEADWEC